MSKFARIYTSPQPWISEALPNNTGMQKNLEPFRNLTAGGYNGFNEIVMSKDGHD